MESTFQEFARRNPTARVRLCFLSDGKTGRLETTAKHALAPNRGQRFFPPDGETAQTLGWGMPTWYASEVYLVCVLGANGTPVARFAVKDFRPPQLTGRS